MTVEKKMQSNEKEVALEKIVTTAIQIPGVKVDRNQFLAEVFVNEEVELQEILDSGPIQANVPQEKLSQISSKLILKRTSQSSIASFATGIPGGLAMAATIPADIAQFFGMSLRLAQELSYLYGGEDLWVGRQPDDEQVKNRLLLYCGVMFGVSGAVSGVRVLSTQIAKTTLKKLPQKALTKGFWYPMVKQIGKAIGIKVTKSSVAKGISKAVPVIGGVISGGLNFMSMMPMANRLQAALDSAAFGYTEEAFEEDLHEIENAEFVDSDTVEEKETVKATVLKNGKKMMGNLSGLFDKKKTVAPSTGNDEVFESIKKLSELKEAGIITQEEFEEKKAMLLSKIV